MDIINIKNLSKTYQIYERNVADRFKDIFLPGKKKRYREFHALKNINLDIKHGDIIGIVGRNGAGKSTLLKIISNITQPSSGSLSVNGRVVPLLELGGGFNPEYTGRENIYFNCSLLGFNKDEIDKIYPEIVEFAELEEFIDVQVKKYSSGMQARLSFATSININPEILIIDEVLSVGDEQFKRKCYAKMEEFFKSGKTVIYVSHSLASVMDLCTTAILMHKGEILLTGSPDLIINQYHKLVYNGIDKSSELEIVDEIKELSCDSERVEALEEQLNKMIPGSELDDDTTSDLESEFYDPDFISKNKHSRKIIDIDIINYGVKQAGTDSYINNIIWGREYELEMNVRFNTRCENISIGCILYDDAYKELNSYFYPQGHQKIKNIEKAEQLIFSTKFHSYLNQGVFGIRLEVRSTENGMEKAVSYISDAILLKCHGNRSKSGYVSLFENAEVKEAAHV